MHVILSWCGILLFSVAFSCEALSDQKTLSGYSFHEHIGGWLKFHLTPKSWDDAVITCYKEGGVLASPLNDDFKDVLSSKMVENQVNETIFTGISNVYSYAVYQSMEGIYVSNIDLEWSVEPKGSDSDTVNCVGMNIDGTVTEVARKEPRAFACFRTKEVSRVCGTPDPKYIMNDQTGSCYKLHTDKANWHEAFKVCDAEGGHLAIVNSQAEAEVIWEIGYNSPWTYALALGFREWGKERTWITIQGRSLKEAGYDKWYPGEPNILSENCGSFVHWGAKSGPILADMPCAVKVMFICEIEPVVEKAKSL